MKLAAILWDYDGTLVDSTKKNIRVTKEVLKNFIPDLENNMPLALTSVEEYQKANYLYKNWKELYEYAYGLTKDQIAEAGKLWSPYQLKDESVPELFEGLSEIMQKLPNIAQGICSQNGAVNISKTLEQYGISDHFPVIIGVDEVSFEQQKPNPAGFLKCLDKLSVEYKDCCLVYIGDHAEDVVFAKNAEQCLLEELNQKNKDKTVKVVTIGVNYSGSNARSWAIQPDYVVKSPKELENILISMS